MLLAVLQLSLPIVVILTTIQWKLNHSQKGVFFKVPLLASSIALSWTIGRLGAGVMGSYAYFFCELLLYPALLGIKKLWVRKEAKLREQKQVSDQSYLALPARAMAVVA